MSYHIVGAASLLVLAACAIGLFGRSAVARAADAGAVKSAPPTGARDYRDVAVVSFAGYDGLEKSVRLISRLAGNSRVLSAVDSAIVKKGLLRGLDTQRPWGGIIQSNGADLRACGFVPITDFKQMLDNLAAYLDKPQDQGNGVLKIAKGPGVFLTRRGDWALLASAPEMFSQIPQDPVQLLGGLHKSYDLAVRIWPKNVSPGFRKQLVDLTASAVKTRDDPLGLILPMVQQPIEQTLRHADELETAQIGLAVDEKTATAHMDCQAVAREGSQTARWFQDMLEGARTDFAGFSFPEAAVALNATFRLAAEDVQRTRTNLARARSALLRQIEDSVRGPSDPEHKLARQVAEDLFSVVDKTVAQGAIDACVTMWGEPKPVLLAGVRVADTAAVEQTLKALVDQTLRNNPRATGWIVWNAEKHQGVSLHKFLFPGEEEEGGKLETRPTGKPEIRPALVETVVGLGKRNVYFASGPGALKLLKQAIDASKGQSDREVPNLRLSAALTPIVKFTASRSDAETDTTRAMVQLLQQSSGKDHVTLTIRPIPGGGRLRVEVEEGLLRVLGAAPSVLTGRLVTPGAPAAHPAGEAGRVKARLRPEWVRVSHIENGKETADPPRLEADLLLTGPEAARATACGMLKIETAQDEHGRPLTVHPVPRSNLGDPQNQFVPIDRLRAWVYEHPDEGVRIPLQLKPQSPAIRRIADFQGTLKLKTAGRQKVVIVKDVAAQPGGQIEDQSLQAADLRLGLLRSKEKNSLKIEVQGKTAALAEIDLTDARGHRLDAALNPSDDREGQPLRYELSASDGIPVGAQLRIVVNLDIHELDVPLRIKNVRVPPMPK